MSTSAATPPPDDRAATARPWLRPVVLVASCLVIGFVAGWIVRGDEGPVTVLAPTQPADGGSADAGAPPTATTPGGSTAPATTVAEPPPPPPDRSEIALAVLNGTGQAGLAASTAGQAESLGYRAVATGNAPAQTGPDVVFFRAGERPAARRVARDLQISAIRPLPDDGALGDELPDDARVVVVLGPG
jgi:hypothetical protein